MKIVFVVGASGDIGQAVCRSLHIENYAIVMGWCTNKEPTRNLLDEFNKSCHYDTKINVLHLVSIQTAIQQCLMKHKQIDILVNCAGILQQKPYDTIDEDDWSIMLDANLRGTFWLCQQIMPVMKKQKEGGVIVTMASSGGQTGGILAVHYSASKAGVISLTKSFAKIGVPNVRVNCVSPGLISSEMAKKEINSEKGRQKISSIPLNRVGTVQEVAQAVMYCINNQYVTGQVINVNGGLWMP
jgi:3-oxoacyl-[acyl-carrier protein] reductase